MKTLFDKTFNVMQKALELRSRRNTVLVSNIANVDTPGFREKDLNFDELMRSYADDLGLGPAEEAEELKLVSTNPRHLDANAKDPPDIIVESTERGTPNNVDLDEQMSKLSANNLQYQAVVQMLVKKFELLRDAVTEGGRQ